MGSSPSSSDSATGCQKRRRYSPIGEPFSTRVRSAFSAGVLSRSYAEYGLTSTIFFSMFRAIGRLQEHGMHSRKKARRAKIIKTNQPDPFF
ncbi:Uncharacterised protein [Bordetella pertussis]|nr:Uncharacterised protein [Bordetella pertussis]